MQHLGASTGNKKVRVRHPIGSAALPGSTKARAGPDALGLASTVNPLTFLVQRPSTDERGANNGRREQTPRRRRLRTSETKIPVAEAFSPQSSLRFSKLPMLTRKEHHLESTHPNQLTTTVSTPRHVELPLHELIQTVDDAVKADPLAELNQSTIARLFMDQWLRQFEADRRTFKSVAVRYEVGFEELQRRTANLPRPNELVTTFSCKVLEDLTPHFGPYAPLFRVLRAELVQSIYSRDGLPYFALVKHHKRLLQTLRKDKESREDRNDVLADDIDKVYIMSRHFLSECTYALARMLLHEWYSVAVVQKKNNRKYIAYYSNWFNSAPRAMLRKVYTAWKREAARHRIEWVQKQLQIDLQSLTAVKRQAEEITVQRDNAQADNLAMRSDRNKAEEWTRQLELRIKAASTFLDTTRRREAQICQEGQLRVEAVACLPPLILESLLRGYHGVGFLQQVSGQEPQADQDVYDDQDTGTSCVLLECLGEITRLRDMEVRRTSSSTIASTSGGRVHSVVAATGRSNSAVIGAAPSENGQSISPQETVAATGSPSGRRVAGAISQDELSGRLFLKHFLSLREHIRAPNTKVLFTPHFQETEERRQSQHDNSQVDREYDHLLRAIRIQDEHYATHSKLFSSRMLEAHEVSLVPNCSMPSSVLQGSAGSDRGDLGVINGVKRSWILNKSAEMLRTTSRGSQFKRASTQRQSILSLNNRSPPPTPLLENLQLLQEADFDISPLHSRGFTVLLLAHIATEYGALLFSPGDMSAFTHNAYLSPVVKATEDLEVENPQDVDLDKPADENDQRMPTPSPPVIVPTAAVNGSTNNSLRIIEPIVTAYNTWNQLSEQLISAGVVQSRGLTQKPVMDPSSDNSGDVLRGRGTAQGTPIRPILQHQFEPSAHSSLLAPVREKVNRRTSNPVGDGNTYHTAKIRHLSPEMTETLTHSIEDIHRCVKTTAAKLKYFDATHQQLEELRITQWQQASELASESSNPKEEATSSNPGGQSDSREQIYECISLTNNTMRRIFSVEDNPDIELTQVRAVFENHQRVIRRLYTPFRANIKHAMSLDDLWHIVKILRLPREIHVLPVLRDEELVANGYEQLFSPEDLAELFLQLCNEQFQPQLAPLSARVEYFVTRHLPIALQNPSLLRVMMHRSDVKLAIHSHSQTIRIIFRRYCAKERELMMPATGPAKPKPRHTGHGINKYMRMVDWQAFVQDYHLIRARFSLDQALNVFRNVQEASFGNDEQLELIYSEFCEALVAMATFYFPDPFVKPATKLMQFLRRYLPLSPDDT
ncbi:hypothetical protein GN244_ATG11310 [Phytophthora infestans]|uniref:Uncharacterized protein n=1 Tax=Phytophthora infestans TaxID=4787 RepID=A0A833T087_PHYIN|nr:hypothetical protein GN244_ATG11310 [Phytophthora infestans]KAF4141005.1 hypothetical protein GN958_ATG09853 [Phytophthora infestans]